MRWIKISFVVVPVALGVWIIPGCGSQSENERAFVSSVEPGQDKPELSGLSYSDRRGKMKEQGDADRTAAKQKKGGRSGR